MMDLSANEWLTAAFGTVGAFFGFQRWRQWRLDKIEAQEAARLKIINDRISKHDQTNQIALNRVNEDLRDLFKKDEATRDLLVEAIQNQARNHTQVLEAVNRAEVAAAEARAAAQTMVALKS